MTAPEREPRSLARGAAAIAVATAVSRATGFLRVVVVAAAMGTTFLANTYQSANTAPNLIFELVAAGVLTSVFVPTFVDFIVKGRREEGWDAANALTSVAVVGLTALALILALAAPLVMRLFLIGVDPAVREDALQVGTSFLRLFAPQVVFYGAGMIMTSALHAHRRFGMAAVAPIFNNVVVIGVYLAYIWMREGSPSDVGSTTTGEIWLLGAGTTAGVLAMTACLIPGLRELGWRFRFRWEPDHPAVRRGARLGVWALGYAGGYQAGLIVVLVLANSVEGGVAAYQWAFTFFYLPHALIGVPIFNVLFTAMSEHVSAGERDAVAVRLRDGLGMLAFILMPLAALLLVLAAPLTVFTLSYGVMTREGAILVARVLTAFALGLPLYSVFLVFTRGFYALGDTKTPALVNAGSVALASLVGAVAFFTLPEGWSVAGLALGHSVGFAAGAIALARLLSKPLAVDLPARLRVAFLTHLPATLVLLAVAATLALPFSGLGRIWSVMALAVAGSAGGAAYLAIMARRRSPELESLTRLMRSVLRSRR